MEREFQNFDMLGLLRADERVFLAISLFVCGHFVRHLACLLTGEMGGGELSLDTCGPGS